MSKTPDFETAIVAKGNFTQHTKRRKLYITTAVLVVTLLVIGYILYAMNKQSADDQLKQTTLQKSLATSQHLSNSNDTIKYATQLIDGQTKGTFKLANDKLGDTYLARATAYVNIKNYKQASSDFERAGSLNDVDKKAALQGRIDAGYRQGQRKELIPLYQQLIEVTKNSDSPTASSSIMQYQGTIKALQKGQEIDI